MPSKIRKKIISPAASSGNSVNSATQNALNLKENIVSGIVATGTDTYIGTYSPAQSGYTDGFKVLVRFTNANTGASTLNLNSQGAISIVKGVNTALSAGDIPAGTTLFLSYDGTNFVIVGSNLVNQFGNWTPSFTGFSANPTAITARYSLIGNLCTCYFVAAAGTSNATTFTITLPFSAANTNKQSAYAVVNDAGTSQAGLIRTNLNSNIADVYKGGNFSGSFTASGNKNVTFTLVYEIA